MQWFHGCWRLMGILKASVGRSQGRQDLMGIVLFPQATLLEFSPFPAISQTGPRLSAPTVEHGILTNRSWWNTAWRTTAMIPTKWWAGKQIWWSGSWGGRNTWWYHLWALLTADLGTAESQILGFVVSQCAHKGRGRDQFCLLKAHAIGIELCPNLSHPMLRQVVSYKFCSPVNSREGRLLRGNHRAGGNVTCNEPKACACFNWFHAQSWWVCTHLLPGMLCLLCFIKLLFNISGQRQLCASFQPRKRETRITGGGGRVLSCSSSAVGQEINFLIHPMSGQPL